MYDKITLLAQLQHEMARVEAMEHREDWRTYDIAKVTLLTVAPQLDSDAAAIVLNIVGKLDAKDKQVSEQDKQDRQIRKNVQDLDALWARMKYLGKTDYKVEWDGDVPIVHWHGQNLGSVADLNDGSMEQLADILDRARKQSCKEE